MPSLHNLVTTILLCRIQCHACTFEVWKTTGKGFENTERRVPAFGMHCFPHEEDSRNSTWLHTVVEIDVGGTRQEGGAGDEALAGFGLNTAEAHMLLYQFNIFIKFQCRTIIRRPLDTSTSFNMSLFLYVL